MSVDSTAATIASGSESDLSSCSNWSVLDDSDNASRYARKIRMGGKKPKPQQSKTKLKPPKANKKFDIEDEIFMMEEVLSKTSSEGSVNLVGDKEESNEPFEEILPESAGPVSTKDSVELFLPKRKYRKHLEGTRARNMSILQFLGLMILMTSFSWITAMFAGRFITSRVEGVIANEEVFAKIADEMNKGLNNNTFDEVNILSDKDLTAKLPDEPTVVILPPENIEDANLTKLDKPDQIKPHFHNDGKLTYGPMTFKDYLHKQKTKLEEMKSTNDLKDKSETFSKTVNDILKKRKPTCDNKFMCCRIKKRLGFSTPCDKPEKRQKEVITKPPVEKVMAQKPKIPKERAPEKKAETKDGLKWDFSNTKIDDIINNFSKYIRKNALTVPKADKIVPRSTKEKQELHKIVKDTELFKPCSYKDKKFSYKTIKECFLFRFAVCMVFDVFAIITLRKLGIVCIGQIKKLMGIPKKPKREMQVIKKAVSEIKRVDMFKLLPFHRTRARPIRKAKKLEKVEKTAICIEGKLIDKSTKPEYPSDYYLFMLGLKMKALDQNLKSREDVSAMRFGMKRYSTEFKQSLIKQLSGIYKDTVKNDRLREDLVFCIMKIYECKFEYAPTCAYGTNEALNRLDKFKALLVDYYRYQDNPLINTKFLKNCTPKQKEDLGHVLELMLEDQKLGATRSNIECTFTADNSTFKYDTHVQQCQSAFLQKPVTSTQSSSNMFKANTASVHSVNDPGYYMRERFSLLAKFWKLKQAYFTKRIQICNILKDKLSESSIAEHEGANILDGIINNAITNSSTAVRSAKFCQSTKDAIKVSEEVITEVVDNVHKVFEAHRREDQPQSPKSSQDCSNPPMCKRICRVNNELYRELFEKKAQAIQEKELSRGRTLLATKSSDMNNAKMMFSKPYQVRDPRLHKKI